MKTKVHRGPKPTTSKGRGYKNQPQLPKGRLPEQQQYARPYPVYYYPYPYPHYQYQYSQPPYHKPAHGHPMPMPPLQPAMQGGNEPAALTRSKKPIDPPCLTDEESVDAGSPSPDVEESDKAEEKEVVPPKIAPHENDVLMGRGGKNNTHSGNEKLREMARDMREVYIKSRKKHKTEMALQLVQQVFRLNPPGRFLLRNPETMEWEEVDLEVARHKTSQCLRDAASEKPSAVKKQAPITQDQEIARATTPVHSNMATHRIEASPPRSQPTEVGYKEARNRFGSWEAGSDALASNLIECWEQNNGSFAGNRRASLNVIEYLEVEDAKLIPPEELDAVADGMESFSLLDASQLEADVHMQGYHHSEESENPFDSEFF